MQRKFMYYYYDITRAFNLSKTLQKRRQHRFERQNFPGTYAALTPF